MGDPFSYLILSCHQLLLKMQASWQYVPPDGNHRGQTYCACANQQALKLKLLNESKSAALPGVLNTYSFFGKALNEMVNQQNTRSLI